MIDAMPRGPYLRGMSDWIGILETAHGLLGWRWRNDSVVGQAMGVTTADILAELGPAEVVLIAPTADAQKVPAKLHPTGAFTDLTDGASRLPAPQRLQMLGFQAAHPDWDGVVLILTGTHSYWCLLSAREVVGFQAFLTPRLIAALDTPPTAQPEAIAETLSRPERLAAHLAASDGVRAAQTGHLIGAELGAARAWWLGQQVAVIGAQALAASYAAGLTAQGVPVALPDDPSPLGFLTLRGGGG